MPSASLSRSRAVLAASLACSLGVAALVHRFTGSGYAALHGGIITGLLALFAASKAAGARVPTTLPALDPVAEGFPADEPITHYGAASHYKGIEAVGGKLLLTSERLRFRSHAINFQRHDESFPLASIRAVEPARSLGVIPNSIRVFLEDGRVERFLVYRRSEWLTRIRDSVAVAVGQKRQS